jgi:hypothetical protein
MKYFVRVYYECWVIVKLINCFVIVCIVFLGKICVQLVQNQDLKGLSHEVDLKKC